MVVRARVVLPFILMHVKGRFFSYFSPNGDGVNDVWNIGNWRQYTGCNVDVYTTFGQPGIQQYWLLNTLEWGQLSYRYL